METLESRATGRGVGGVGGRFLHTCVCVRVFVAEQKSRWHGDFENPKLGMFS